MRKHHLLQILKLSLAVALLFWLWKTDKIQFSEVLKIIDPYYGPFILISIVTSLFAYVTRLHVILSAKNMAQNFWHTWRLSMMGLFFNFTLPGGTSGDVIKVFYLCKEHKDRKASAVGLVVLDRLIGLFGMMSMAFVGLLIRPEELLRQRDLQIIFSVLASALCVLVLLLGFFVYCSKKNYSAPLLSYLLKFKFLQKTFDTAVHLADYKLFFKALFFTLVTQASAVLVLYTSALAIGYTDLDLVAFFIVAPLGFIVTAVPISPAGIGIGQLAFMSLFKIYTGVESDLGPTVITVYQILLFLAGLSGLYHYLRWGPGKNLKAQEYQSL